MSESQRTPGDWQVVNEGSAVFGGEQMVASVFGDAEFMTGPVALANARLIAAAPDLLAVCRVVLADCDDTFHDPDDMSPAWKQIASDCRAAIDKAEGGAA